MERVVTYEGVEVARFEWVGALGQDTEAAIGTVEAAFVAWPAKHIPAYPRLQLIARVLSGAVRAPYGQVPVEGLAFELLTERDKDLETRIEAGFLHRRGLRKLERIYKRERVAMQAKS